MSKFVKLWGLSVVVVVVLAACLGAGSASATVLCKNSRSTCTSKYETGTKYTASLKSGSELTLAAGFTTIKCTGGSLGFEQNGNGGLAAPVPIEATALSYTGCNTTFNVTSLGSGNITWTSGSSGSITGSGTNVEIVAGSTKCFYGGSITSGLTVTGGETASAAAVNVSLTRQTGSSALCANPSKWNASYKFTGATKSAWVANS